MFETKVRGDVNLNYLFRFKCINIGRMKYLLANPEFNKRMTELTLSGIAVDEYVLKDVITKFYNDAESGVFDASDISLPAVRNVIRRLEREIATKAD